MNTEKLKELYQKYEEIIWYLVIGGLTTVISLGTKYALLFTILDAKDPWQLQMSVMISWFVAVLFAYVTNRKLVFKSKNQQIGKEMAKFFGARVATLVMEAILMWFFVTFLHWDSDLEVMIITIAVQVLIVIGNYILSKAFVFAQKGQPF